MASLLRLLPASMMAAGLLAGCAGDGSFPFGGTSTAAVDKPVSQRADPACVALNSKIDALRKDGVSDRAAQAAAAGKSTTVPVKRASLAQLAELDKANAEFQSKCSTLGPRTAAAAVAAPPAAVIASAPAAAKAAPAVARVAAGKAAPQAVTAAASQPAETPAQPQ